jgi:hypothetical protein
MKVVNRRLTMRKFIFVLLLVAMITTLAVAVASADGNGAVFFNNNFTGYIHTDAFPPKYQCHVVRLVSFPDDHNDFTRLNPDGTKFYRWVDSESSISVLDFATGQSWEGSGRSNFNYWQNVSWVSHAVGEVTNTTTGETKKVKCHMSVGTEDPPEIFIKLK